MRQKCFCGCRDCKGCWVRRRIRHCHLRRRRKRMCFCAAAGKRERQEEPLRLRQKKLLQAVEKYVSQQERGQVRLLLKMMDMKEILGQGE